MYAHPGGSKSWNEEFVKKLTDEEHVAKLTMNMDGKSSVWLSNAPMIANRFNELHGSRQVRPKKFVTAIIMGQQDQRRTIGWQNSTTVGTHVKKNQSSGQLKITRTFVTTLPARGLSADDVQTAMREELEFMENFPVLKEVPVEQCKRIVRHGYTMNGWPFLE